MSQTKVKESVLSNKEQASIDSGSPQAESPDDPATVAFESLRKEVALVRRAVAGLAAERATSPDYSETLGNILQAGMVTARRLQTLTELPTLHLTPEEMARQITTAGEAVRRADHVALAEANTAMRETAQELQHQLQSARAAKRQRIWLLTTGVVGLVAGMVLWAVIAGFKAPTAPASHQSPEQKAAEILGMDQKAAGKHLIQTAAPGLWQDVLLGQRIVVANREVLRKCSKQNRKPSAKCVITLLRQEP